MGSGRRFVRRFDSALEGQAHTGSIDTLGIDQNGCPRIIGYKRSTNENVINQGLLYLDWLLDHRGEFELLLLQCCGKETADAIKWPRPRLLCTARDFTKYAAHAVQQINRNIELLRYVSFGGEFLMLELVNAIQSTSEVEQLPAPADRKANQKQSDKTVTEQLALADSQPKDLFETFKATCLSFGDDEMKRVGRADLRSNPFFNGQVLGLGNGLLGAGRRGLAGAGAGTVLAY